MAEGMFTGSSGPKNARIAIVGESWGQEERVHMRPFVGSSGQEFTRILNEAGIDRNQCFMTNCFNAQPENNEAWTFFQKTKEATVVPFNGLYPTPWARSQLDRLAAELHEVKPDIIIAAGNYPLWALTDCASIEPVKDKQKRATGVHGPVGITRWRGSMVRTRGGRQCLPIIHPAAIQRQWELRSTTVHDLRARVPMGLEGDWENPKPGRKLCPPTFEQAIHYLDNLRPGDIVCDIETKPKAGILVCIGLAQDFELAISIPFVRLLKSGRTSLFESYWTLEQEVEIVRRLRAVFRRTDLCFIGSNFTYDQQWILRDLGVLPPLGDDTQLAHYTLFPGMLKGLGFISSLYRKYHRFWKEDSFEWDTRDEGLEEHLSYNCDDLWAALECMIELRALVKDMGFERQYAEIKEENQDLALDMMLRGVPIDLKVRTDMGVKLLFQRGAIATWLEERFPNAIFGSGTDSQWYESNEQTGTMFYDYMGLKEIRDRKTGSRSVGKEALEELSNKYVPIRPIIRAIQAMRSLDVFQSHFIRAPLEPVTNRLVCSFNSSGTETFRWSSSKNCFGRGTNLQNIPTGNED